MLGVAMTAGFFVFLMASALPGSSGTPAVVARSQASSELVFSPLLEGASGPSMAHFEAYFPATVGAYVTGVEFGGGDSSTATIVLPEWWGLDGSTIGYAQQIAAGGGRAFALNQYRSRTVPVEFSSAQEVTDEITVSAHRMLTANWMALVEDVQSLVDDYRKKGVNTIGLIGWSFGGCLALLSAHRVKGLDAVVAMYGAPDEKFTNASRFFDPSQVEIPTLLVAGTNDAFGFSSESHLREVHRKLSDSELYVVEGGDHAFMMDQSWWEAWKAAQSPPRTPFNSSMAQAAWARATAFLEERYATPAVVVDSGSPHWLYG